MVETESRGGVLGEEAARPSQSARVLMVFTVLATGKCLS